MRAIGAVLTGIAFVCFVSGADATSVRFARGPAEMPPAGFKGVQFVDSKGCAYIKAGYSGNVTWVPRAHRNRQVMCGLKPTFARTATKGKAAKRTPTQPLPAKVRVLRVSKVAAKPQPAVKQPAVKQPAVKKARTKVSGFPAPTVFTAYKEPPRKTTARPLLWAQTKPVAAQKPVNLKPAATLFTKRKSKPATKPQRPARAGVYAIRRGPQRVHPADAVKRYRRDHGIQVASAPYAVPKGYVSLLSENPATGRGVGTPQGQAAMDLLWTQTMPRRLIDVTTGKDMTAGLPQIKYPYTSASVRRVAYAAVARPAATKPRLKRIKKPVSDAASPLNMTSLDRISSIQDVSAQTGRKPVVPVVKPLATHRFVQVATFGVADNARRTKARFSEKGMPVDTRPTRYKGKQMDIVLLGPFRDQRMLDEALSQARASGFKDAFFVN